MFTQIVHFAPLVLTQCFSAMTDENFLYRHLLYFLRFEDDSGEQLEFYTCFFKLPLLVLLESMAAISYQWFNRIYPFLSFLISSEQCHTLPGLYCWLLGSLLVCIINILRILISCTHRRPLISDTKFDI